jgi:hypothetical protein
MSRQACKTIFLHALNGTEERVFDRHGNVIGSKTRYSERLMMFLLRVSSNAPTSSTANCLADNGQRGPMHR